MKEGIYFPSKLVDYLVNRKPVIGLSPEKGIFADLLPCKGLIRVDADDEEAIGNAIEFYYDKFREGILDDFAPSEELAGRFEAENVADKFLSKISTVIEKKDTRRKI